MALWNANQKYNLLPISGTVTYFAHKYWTIQKFSERCYGSWACPDPSKTPQGMEETRDPSFLSSAACVSIYWKDRKGFTGQKKGQGPNPKNIIGLSFWLKLLLFDIARSAASNLFVSDSCTSHLRVFTFTDILNHILRAIWILSACTVMDWWLKTWWAITSLCHNWVICKVL